MPFELVDAVLAEPRSVQRRLRDLPFEGRDLRPARDVPVPESRLPAGLGQAGSRAGRGASGLPDAEGPA
ncbi:hypothetical protein [Streptomyces sp. NPDC006285]|uniref:hypothetical protein n=1 Tax=Streptomyces sp. NPDC006285 TaxID=3364742 RepID=UPI0036886F57